MRPSRGGDDVSARAAAAITAVRERLERLETLIKEGDAGSATETRYERWKDRTERVLAEQVSPHAAAQWWGIRAASGAGGVPGFFLHAVEAREFLDGLLHDLETSPEDALAPLQQPAPGPAPASEAEHKGRDPRRVFVVHGRNVAARDALFTFLRAIGLDPIEWDPAVALTGQGAPYIGSVLDRAFAEAQAVVVLLTGDDEARLRQELQATADPPHEKELTPQPRPNVLFEAGLAFGRHPERTILVELGPSPLRRVSDVMGRHTVRIDNSPEKRNALANRLKTAGCAVDLGGTDWFKAGNFDAAEILSSGQTSDEPRAGHRFDVDDTALQILASIAESRIPITALNLAGDSDLDDVSDQRMRYYLGELEAAGYVSALHFYTGQESEYTIAQPGRRLLVERRLL
jgi:predicted nucleotide-binding protein